MKKLIYTPLLALAVASFNVCIQPKTVKASEAFALISNVAQSPKIVKPSNANNIRQSFSLSIPQSSSGISEIIINIPSGLDVGKDITVSDNSQRIIKTNINVNHNKIFMAFPQPVPPGATLNVSLNDVSAFGVSNAWDYSVSAKFVGINKEISVGVVQYGIY